MHSEQERSAALAPPGAERSTITAGGTTAGPMPLWITVVALAWSASAIALGALWLLGLLTNPFDDPDSVSLGAVLNLADPAIGPAVVAALGAAGMASAVAVTRPGGSRVAGAVGWAVVAITVLVLVNGKLLMALGYTLALPVLVPLVPELWGMYVHALADPQLLLCVHSVIGALVWLMASLALGRRRRGGCLRCGRDARWSVAEEVSVRRRALRIGRMAVAVGSASALIYPAVRFPWLFGGLGIGDMSSDQITTGVGLAGAALLGVGLMTGLVANWGARVPRWMIGLAGRRVPITQAVLPASVIAIAFCSLGRGVVLTPHLWLNSVGEPLSYWVNVIALAAMLPWGIALTVATVAYAVRRRAECLTCARGCVEELPGDMREVNRDAETARSTGEVPH